MKLIIQIPCFNEAETLPATLADLPRELDGFTAVEWLVIDDGSSDGTHRVARAHGVHHIVRLGRNRGLAAAFRAGIDAGLRLGADVIVNTDGDNQYCGADVGVLTGPILAGQADIVVGDRQPGKLEHFSPLKRKLQILGSWVVSQAAGAAIADTTSGFRAFSREAALRLNLVSTFTYTLETLIQAGQAGLTVRSEVIRTNPTTRKSRLFGSIPEYVRRSAATILRVALMYRPLSVFLATGGILLAIAATIGLRFVYYWAFFSGSGKVQSLILAGALAALGGQLIALGLVADLIAANRKLLEEQLVRLRRVEAETFSGQAQLHTVADQAGAPTDSTSAPTEAPGPG